MRDSAQKFTSKARPCKEEAAGSTPELGFDEVPASRLARADAGKRDAAQEIPYGACR
jgi:hypothetical protein